MSELKPTHMVDHGRPKIPTHPHTVHGMRPGLTRSCVSWPCDSDVRPAPERHACGRLRFQAWADIGRTAEGYLRTDRPVPYGVRPHLVRRSGCQAEDSCTAVRSLCRAHVEPGCADSHSGKWVSGGGFLLKSSGQRFGKGLGRLGRTYFTYIRKKPATI